jgi:hypothetical protein
MTDESTVADFHAALDACAFTNQELPSLAQILTNFDPRATPAVSVAGDKPGLEDITPPGYPLRVLLDRETATKKKDKLLKGFAGWSITSVQPCDFTQLCVMEIDGEKVQWTDYQAKVLVAMAVARAMGWAEIFKSKGDGYPMLRMKRDAITDYVPEHIQKLMGMLGPAADEALKDLTAL